MNNLRILAQIRPKLVELAGTCGFSDGEFKEQTLTQKILNQPVDVRYNALTNNQM